MESVTKTILTEEQLTLLVKKNFGEEYEVLETEMMTDGWFNAIYSLTLNQEIRGNREIVLKLGVQEGKFVCHYEQNLLRAELQVYRLFEENGIPVPYILSQDTTRTLVDCDYFFMEKKMGSNWERLEKDLSAHNKEELLYAQGRYAAMMHSISGEWFGYIKDNLSYHYPSWKQAFRAMLDSLMHDAFRENVQLPENEIYGMLEPYWDLLDEVKTPSLIHFDMWRKNIMLRKEGEEYVIDGFIDLERGFYGDPVCDLIAMEFEGEPLDMDTPFMKGYTSVRPLVLDRNAKIRLAMYKLYFSLLGNVEIYRYEGETRKKQGAWSSGFLKDMLKNMREVIEETKD